MERKNQEGHRPPETMQRETGANHHTLIDPFIVLPNGRIESIYSRFEQEIEIFPGKSRRSGKIKEILEDEEVNLFMCEDPKRVYYSDDAKIAENPAIDHVIVDLKETKVEEPQIQVQSQIVVYHEEFLG